MKWFKHMSGASDDDKISELEDEHGLEGYAVFFKTLEMIARDFDDNDPSVRYSKQKLKRKLGISAQKLTKIYDFLNRIQLLSVKKDGDFFTIESENMAKFRDNWTGRPKKNSVVTTEELPLEVEEEVEEDNILSKKEKVNGKAKSKCDFDQHWEGIRVLAPSGRSSKANSRTAWVRCRAKYGAEEIVGAYKHKAATYSDMQFVQGFQVFAKPDNIQDWIDQGRPSVGIPMPTALSDAEKADHEADTQRRIADMRNHNGKGSLKI